MVEHNLAKVGVASSSLVFRSKSGSCESDCLFLCQTRQFIPYCGNSSVGRAQPCQGWGREFESRFPLKRRSSPNGLLFSFDTKAHTKRPHSPLSGVGGVKIVRENCLREARVRVSFSAQRTKDSIMLSFFSSPTSFRVSTFTLYRRC